VAAALEGLPPEGADSCPKTVKAEQVARHRVVVEIAANHPIEPLPLSPDGLMTRRRWSSSRIASSVARIRFFAVSRSTWKSPFLLVLQQCVNPRKSKVSGLPKVALGQHLIFEAR